MLDNDGILLTVDARIKQMRGEDKYAAAFKGTGSAGGGAVSDDSIAIRVPQTREPRRSQMTSADKKAYIAKHGGAAFQALPY